MKITRVLFTLNNGEKYLIDLDVNFDMFVIKEGNLYRKVEVGKLIKRHKKIFLGKIVNIESW